MKKILLAGILLINCLIPFAQTNTDTDTSFIKLNKPPRFFVNIHTGYAIGLGSTFKFYPDDITSVMVEQTNGQTPAVKTKSKSTTKGLGDGFRYGAGFSYILNDFINLGIDFDYFRSTINRNRDSSYHSVSGTTEYTFNQHSKISYDATLLTLSPAITFKAISKPKFYIYNKVGAVITFRPNSIQKNESNATMNSSNPSADSASAAYTRYEWGIKKPALGFMGSVGCQFRLTESIRAFGEVQFSHIVFSVKNRVLTDYIVDGKNLTNTLTESEKVIDFENSFSSDNESSDSNQPTKSVVQRIPITYVGLQLGLAYRF